MLSRRLVLSAPFVAIVRSQTTGPEIRFDGNIFRVSGWPPPQSEPEGGWSSLFSVHAASSPDTPAILGTYSIVEGALTFTPRFQLAVPVRAVLRMAADKPIEAIFTPQTTQAKQTTRVEQVYPSAGILPANLLRFYVHFSGPMRRGEAWDHIRLLDRTGKPVELPFLELDQELWDAESRRLTVLFDPGRIKRGVLPRDESGTALMEGSEYTLVIDTTWPDQHGAPLVAEFRKKFRVAPEARAAIDIKTWKLRPPAAKTTEALVVDFPAPLDHALLHRLLDVNDGAKRVKGRIQVTRNETQWMFIPESPWSAEEFLLKVDTALEDVAGNRVGKPFDVDVFDPITTKITRQYESIAFRPLQK